MENMTIVEFMEENFESTLGNMDIDREDENAITVWNYDGDTVIFALSKDSNEYYKLVLFHRDNISAKREDFFLEPSKKELIEMVNKFVEIG